MASNEVSELHVKGSLTCKTFSPPASCITDAAVAAAANIDADKLQHRFRVTFNQIHGSVATTERRPVYCARTTGVVYSIKAGSVVACSGAATITVDLKKNGTTMLTGVITLDNANTAYIVESGTLSVTSLVAGDMLEIVVVATAGGGTLGQGLFVTVDIDEDYG